MEPEAGKLEAGPELAARTWPGELLLSLVPAPREPTKPGGCFCVYSMHTVPGQGPVATPGTLA